MARVRPPLDRARDSVGMLEAEADEGSGDGVPTFALGRPVVWGDRVKALEDRTQRSLPPAKRGPQRAADQVERPGRAISDSGTVVLAQA